MNSAYIPCQNHPKTPLVRIYEILVAGIDVSEGISHCHNDNKAQPGHCVT